MNLTLRLSDRLIALQNMISMYRGQSSKDSDRASIFIQGLGFQIETQPEGDDFNHLLFFLLFWDGTPDGQVEDVKAFYTQTLPFMSAESIAHFDKLKSK